jgi:anti-sigma factor RsiW
MNLTKDVILDLLPVYLAGESSAATRQLVEEFLKQDPELAEEIRRQMVENLAAVAPPAMPPELELRSLRRTRGVLARQQWLFGAAILFSLLPLSSGGTFRDGRLTSDWMLLRDYPELAGISLAIAIGLWVWFGVSRRRLRTVV